MNQKKLPPYEFKYEDYKDDNIKVIDEVVTLIENKLDITFEIKDSVSLLNNVDEILENSKKRKEKHIMVVLVLDTGDPWSLLQFKFVDSRVKPGNNGLRFRAGM